MRSIIAASCAVLGFLGGCRGGGQKAATADSPLATTSSVAAGAVNASPGKTPCRPTGQWTDCAVFERLDQAGLAPRRDSSGARVELSPLTGAGSRVTLGTAELDIFIYPDAASREKDEAHLDRSKYIEATDEPTLRGEATLIRNMNLLAVLHSRSDHQRERVSDALTAGPPTPGTGRAR